MLVLSYRIKPDWIYVSIYHKGKIRKKRREIEYNLCECDQERKQK